jgi:hypothetical protein
MSFPFRGLMVMLALVAASAGGCGPRAGKSPDLAEAVVIVTIGGQPLPHALVTFTPTGSYGSDAFATGVTDESGRATLSSGGKPGACLGPNKVTVVDAPAPEEVRGDDLESQRKSSEYRLKLKNRPIPNQYSNLAQSDLTVEVQ